MRVAILDEAGDAGFGEGASSHMLVAVAVIGNIELLRRAVTRTRKRLDKRRRDLPEFKAFKTDPRITRQLLANVVATGCEIVIAAADKRALAPLRNGELLYRELCSQAARRCVERYGQVRLILDKRYSDARLTRLLVDAISQGLGSARGVLVIEPPRDSLQERAIQAVDAVAWAVFQKLEHSDTTFYEAVKANVVCEEWLK
jgi:hypothetical protein